jgi:transcriptional regulator with XRE-family HTH domain
VKKTYEGDIDAACAGSTFPPALERKYPNAPMEWPWQYAFPATRLCIETMTGKTRRHHLHETVLQRAIKSSALRANVETGRIKLPLLANLREIADALEVSIEALVEGTTSEQLLTAPRPADRAYCPNPDCPGATEGLMRNNPVVVHFSLSRFDEDDEERKFCPHCRSKLVAVCPKPGCGANIHSDVTQYCYRCGEPLYAAWEKEFKQKDSKKDEPKQ